MYSLSGNPYYHFQINHNEMHNQSIINHTHRLYYLGTIYYIETKNSDIKLNLIIIDLHIDSAMLHLVIRAIPNRGQHSIGVPASNIAA